MCISPVTAGERRIIGKKRKRIELELDETGCDVTFEIDEEEDVKTVKKCKTTTTTIAATMSVDSSTSPITKNCESCEDSNSFDWESNQSGGLSEVDIFAENPEASCGSDSEKLTPMEIAQKLITKKWFIFEDDSSITSKLDEIKTALCKIEKFLLYFNSWLGLDESQLLGSFLVLIDRMVERMGRQPVSRYFDTFIVIALLTCKAFSEYKWKMAHFKSLWESISGWTGEQTGVTQEWWEYAEIQAFKVLDWNIIITNEEIQELLSEGRGGL